MSEELRKRLERAEKYVSKNKLEAAIEEYEAIVRMAPERFELLHTLGDLCLRVKKKERALAYYGELFDKYAERGEVSKALPLFHKSLQGTPQPAERHFRLGQLLQNNRRPQEAAQAFRQALDAFRQEGNSPAVMECLDRIGALEPDSAEIQLQMGEQALRLGRAEIAAKAFLRAGQLVGLEDPDRALEFLERARELAPSDRAVTLHFARALAAKGSSTEAIEMLQPLYAANDRDLGVLTALAEALLGAGRLAEAAQVLESLYKLQPNGYDLLFRLADLYSKGNQAANAVEVLRWLKERLFDARRQKEYLDRMEVVWNQNPGVIPVGEFVARVFNEINQENRYGATLSRLFHLYCQAQDFPRASDALERLIELDPYDLNHQKRLQQIKGKVEESRYRALTNRITGAPPVTAPAPTPGIVSERAAPPAGENRQVMLEDMIVQAEIFLQYSLKAKAIEKLQRIHELFPGEETQNQRLYKLFELAQYFPPGFGSAAVAPSAPPPAEPAASAVPPAEPAVVEPTASVSALPSPSGPELARDLAKISEITHALYREGTTKLLLHKAVSEVGHYLQLDRCLAVLGRPLTSPTAAVEYCAPGVQRSSGVAVSQFLEVLTKRELNQDRGTELETNATELKGLGVESSFAMPIVDKETGELEGVLSAFQVQRRQWQSNEVYLLKAVADQVEIAVSHLKLRSLMKSLSVTDGGTGLLSRSSYLDALTSEVARAKTQGTPLVLSLLELDKGTHWLRNVGEETIQKFMQQAGETLLSQMRPNDIAFRYTTTALAWVMVDTTTEKVKSVVERLRRQLNSLKLPGTRDGHSFSAGVSEAAIRPDYDPLDIVTDVINRAEFSLEDARKKGNTTVTR